MAETPHAGSPGRVEIDPTEAAMHEMVYGMYIVGSVDDGEPNGMIADWVMQVSFDPRLVAVSFENDSRSLGRIRENKAFTVNLLAEGQAGLELAQHFLQPYEGSKIGRRSAMEAAKKHHKLEGLDYRTTESGCPILDGAMTWLECEAEQFIAVGDHTLVIGRVLRGEVVESVDPLTSVYAGWTYSG